MAAFRMKPRIALAAPLVLAFVLAGCGGLAAPDGEPDVREFDLADYKWKRRVLLVFAPSAEHPEYKVQTAAFSGREQDLADRDVTWIELFRRGRGRLGDRTLHESVAEALRERYRVAPYEFTVILIGKDGRAKFRRTHAAKADYVFELIDAMPMRRREAAERGR